MGGYSVDAKTIGMATDPRTANAIKEVNKQVSSGTTAIEVSTVSPEIFDSMPQEQLKEIKRMSDLTGVDITFHAPLVDASGLTKEGFTEAGREQAERQMVATIDRAQVLNKNGNMPITFHSAVQLPGALVEPGKEEEETLVINSETGSLNRVPLKKRHFPGEKEVRDPETEIKHMNKDSWTERLRNLSYYAQMGNESINRSKYSELMRQQAPEEFEKDENLKEAKTTFERGMTFLDSSYRDVQNMFDTAYRSVLDNNNEDEKKILDQLKNDIQKNAEQIAKDPNSQENLMLRKKVIDDSINTLQKITPETIKPLRGYALNKSTETFSNVALETWKKYKDKSPIISIENPPAGTAAFSTGKELKELVTQSKQEFVEKAVQQNLMSESDAKKQADKMLGVTLDVGHMNMLRKHGYSEAQLLEETEAVAPLTKHVHLSDNFGFEHTELPMGMGNVPIKEILQKLGEKGYEGKKIVEAGNWWQHFSDQGKVSPLQPTLGALGTPMYTGGGGPSWGDASNLYQGYSSGFGMMLPQINYNTFGAGFSKLPAELGGQVQGGQGSRLGGTPME
ncbi:hypothetical protein HN832_03735 [archaeon]|jgi:sugar phosphate isomerase/epimerase|nr:hypothetical protein [archaeon]MBT4373494.1 hypothetical protein [archaeon]MBT4531942.1 hypothetical protein [archaeon]MBT7001609.1 hypothetical protein [archaeon]MBT7282499.1 hypothetical protein [archaeon]